MFIRAGKVGAGNKPRKEFINIGGDDLFPNVTHFTDTGSEPGGNLVAYGSNGAGTVPMDGETGRLILEYLLASDAKARHFLKERTKEATESARLSQIKEDEIAEKLRKDLEAKARIAEEAKTRELKQEPLKKAV